MIRLSLLLSCMFTYLISTAQALKQYSAAEVYQELKSLPVFGSVLYIAAHPDDENTRLLAYLANGRHLRTGYLSITRGDGGQNLIGDDQGIDLGLVRTQELLAARRIDGAQQFFTRAFDFGYSKSPEEALRIWGHDQVLADVVWVIRNFRPDVIITRFPTTGEGGHGHHTASAILAGEAFDAAADPKMFPDQLAFVLPWQAKRLLWNTFNFGGNNTTREEQLKMDVGGFNAILGKSYGELAAESRSQHKSQGFGVAGQRGSVQEYFKTIKGIPPVNDLMDGVDGSGFNEVFTDKAAAEKYHSGARQLVADFSISSPKNIVPDLLKLKDFKPKKDLDAIAMHAGGIYAEAIAAQQMHAVGDSMDISFILNNRDSLPIIGAEVLYRDQRFSFPAILPNENAVIKGKLYLPAEATTQPYWLKMPKETGSYIIDEMKNVGKPENDPPSAEFVVRSQYGTINSTVPILYKFTDPVKAELYEPIQIDDPVSVHVSPSLLIFNNERPAEKLSITYSIKANTAYKGPLKLFRDLNGVQTIVLDTTVNFVKGEIFYWSNLESGSKLSVNNVSTLSAAVQLNNKHLYNHAIEKISYDHIPDIFYSYKDTASLLKMDLKLAGTKAGYIAGAGDKVPEAMTQMGYTVTMLNAADITPANLAKYDVIVTGVRAYNIHGWLSDKYVLLMNYVKNGGTLVVQYNTNNSFGPVKAKISPYPFNISRTRVTDENAKVNFVDPSSPILNYPNKITQKDFDGWIQERSIYQAENADAHYQKVFTMNDSGEAPSDGSLLVADYGKGKFVYTGLVFFRELPAAVPGAFRLWANILAKKK